MKLNYTGGTALLMGLGLVLGAPAVSAESVLIIKGGNYTLDKSRQNIDADSVIGPYGYMTSVDLIIDKTSSTAVAFAYEWRTRKGFSLGPEILLLRHRYTGTTTYSGTPVRGDMSTWGVLFAPKYYFRPKQVINPYVGVGLGFGFTDITGDVEASTANVLIQVSGGVEFRWDQVGLYTEVRRLLTDSALDSADVNIEGKGLFVGMSMHF